VREKVHPAAGSVAFGASTQGWAFTIDQFAAVYAGSFGPACSGFAASPRLVLLAAALQLAISMLQSDYV
jgi:hypothetical protein